ncbi:MAG: DNA polymerase I [Cytophagaceae bacterium]|jgi:DNA polymerase-1|nr:DNA polymerase I [Cytophagaceae bacterium]
MIENKKTLFLLDAYALIFRAYYAFIRAPRINSKGLNTSAIFGFVNTLRDIIEREKPDFLGVVIDYPAPTFRNEMYSEYKAQREATPEDIKRAVPYIRQILKAMHIPLIEVKGFEADDVIGTLATRASSEGFITCMVTPDKDFAQLVSENIKIYKPRSKSNEIDIWGVDEVKEHFSVPQPINVIDVLALWGDTADNVPGCPGIGEKSAKAIISKYGAIDNVYANINDFKGKQKENLIEYRTQVELARRLVTIETAVPVDCSFDEFKLKTPDIEKLKELFDELEFKSLWQKIAGETTATVSSAATGTVVQGSLFDNPAIDEVAALSRFKTIANVSHKYTLVEGEQALIATANKLLQQKTFSFDTETTGLHVSDAEVVGISFAWKAHEACYIPVPSNFAEAQTILNHFKPALEHPNIEKVGQNIKFDVLMLKKYGINVSLPLFDTMTAHHLLQPGLKHNMDYLSETLLNYSPVAIETLIGQKGKEQRSMRQVSVADITEYAAEDADITLQLKTVLEKQLTGERLTAFFHEVEMPLTLVLADMEYTGVKIDVSELNIFSMALKKRLLALENTIIDMAGAVFNVNSPRQTGEVLFDKLKISGNAVKTQKSGQYSTNEEVLQKLKDKHPIVPLILEQRGVKKLLSTYVDALPQMVAQSDNRLHTSYNQAIVVTGRLSSSNPNLQNIPVRNDDGREIRKAFVVEGNDRLFLSADYSQVELRIMAHLSNDQNLIAAFKRGEDIHTATAALIHKIPVSEVTSDMRRKAKTANFGIIYGISAFGLADRLNISRSDAKALIDGYFESFPDVKTFMDSAIGSAREKGYVETLFGRRCYLPDINSRNSIVRGGAERNAINAPIQGTAADIIKKAMVDIHKRLADGGFQSKMILQVHDELNFEVVGSEINCIRALVKEAMENACQLAVPLAVGMGIGKNWLEAH